MIFLGSGKPPKTQDINKKLGKVEREKIEEVIDARFFGTIIHSIYENIVKKKIEMKCAVYFLDTASESSFCIIHSE